MTIKTLLETPRLRLRLLTEEDADFILRLLNEPAFLRYIGDRGVRTPEDARGYIYNKIIVSYQSVGFGLYGVENKTDAAPIGIAGFVKRPALDHPDIGFAFLERYWFQGYAYEATAAVMDYGRSVLKLSRIFGVTAPDNHSSIRLLEKLGLRFEHMLQIPGVSAEQKLFSTPESDAVG